MTMFSTRPSTHREMMPVSQVSPVSFELTIGSRVTSISDRVLSDTGHLANLGYDVSVVFPDQGFTLDPSLQNQVHSAVASLERDHPHSGIAEFLFDPITHPVGHVWRKLSKRAVALNTLYEPDQETLGGDVDAAAYSQPLFNGKSAKEIMSDEKGGEKASTIVGDYHRLIEMPMHDGADREDKFGLKSYPYLAGIPDSIAVRTRASAAVDEILVYANANKDRFNAEGSPLKVASLACGAAGPMFKLLTRLEESGIAADKVKLIDWDVMALATAASMAERRGVGDKVEVLRKDLLRSNLSSYVSDANVVDLLGLFEYFPDSVGKGPIKYHLAQNFIQELGGSMKPGSLIVFGNMLGKDERPHQKTFNQVWPTLEQRSVGAVLAMLNRAGFKKDAISVRIPNDGIYAIYAIRIPESGTTILPLTGLQKRIRDGQLRSVSEY